MQYRSSASDAVGQILSSWKSV